jgi:hypothetical protein
MRTILLIVVMAAFCSCKKECIEPEKKRVTPAPDRIIERPALEPRN